MASNIIPDILLWNKGTYKFYTHSIIFYRILQDCAIAIVKTNHTVGEVALKSICRIDSNLIPIPYDSSLFLKCAHICIYKYSCIKNTFYLERLTHHIPISLTALIFTIYVKQTCGFHEDFNYFAISLMRTFGNVNISMLTEIISLY